MPAPPAVAEGGDDDMIHNDLESRDTAFLSFSLVFLEIFRPSNHVFRCVLNRSINSEFVVGVVAQVQTTNTTVATK